MRTPHALTPFYDHTIPTVALVELLAPGGAAVDDSHVSGPVDLVASAFDMPPLAPPPPWQVARLAPATIWWVLLGPDPFPQSYQVVDFQLGIPPNALYPYIYAPGTYQNKPNRPGLYLFWLAHSLDTSSLPNGNYELTVFAEDTRGNIGTQTLDFQTTNSATAQH